MKKLISIISIILTMTLLSTFPAFATDSWETDPIELTDTSSGSGWETEDIPFDGNETKKIAVSKCSVSNIKSKTYTGKKLYQSLTVKYGKKTLVKGTDYTLSYKNNVKVGTATVTITGKGKFKDSVKKTFKINPKGTTISKVTKPKTKQIKVSWKKQTTQTTGYQIRYTNNSAKKYTTVSNNKTNAKTIKNLKKNKKYYVRIRTYKLVNGKKYYSAWSKSKTITTK